MYVEFFGLRELPFNNTPDPRFFFSTPDHEEALASLTYAVQQRKGFVLLTGEIGAGKTLVSRMMLRHFNGSIEFATINHAVQSADDLMEAVCTELQLPIEPGLSQTQLVRRLHDFLLAKFAQNVPVVLVLDEAQNLPLAAFEQLRMIGNLESDDAKLLQICIVGQPELQQIIQSPQVKQLRQRIFRSFHLPALDRPSTESYIRHRVCVAGAADAELFTAGAIDAIFDFSQGLPRLINAVCDNSLLSAYSAGRKPVDQAIVAAVVKQMMPLSGEGEFHPKQAQEHSRLQNARLRSPNEPSPDPSGPAFVAASSGDLSGSHVHGPSERPAVAREPGSAAASRQAGESNHQINACMTAPMVTELAEASGRAEILLQRLQAEAAALQNREDRFVALSSALRTMAAEITRSLGRMQRATDQSRQAEAAARSAQAELAAEVDRAAHAAASLRAARADSSDSFSAPIRRVQDVSRRRLSDRTWSAATTSGPLIVNDASLGGLLNETRQAIDGLRGVTGRRPGPDGRTNAPADRLALQAETLLDMLGAIPS